MRIAIAPFDDAGELDFARPWEVLSYRTREVTQYDVEVFTVADTLEPICTAATY